MWTGIWLNEISLFGWRQFILQHIFLKKKILIVPVFLASQKLMLFIQNYAGVIFVPMFVPFNIKNISPFCCYLNALSPKISVSRGRVHQWLNKMSHLYLRTIMFLFLSLQFMFYGFLQCVDSFLFIFTFLPLRLIIILLKCLAKPWTLLMPQ